VLDIGSIDYFNIEITAEADGEISYLIHVSDTGQFGGEETEYLIENGDFNITAFYGRYIYVTARCQGTTLSRMTVSTNTSKVSLKLTNVDTSTLSGTAANRTLSVSAPISAIYDIHVQPRAATSYAVNLYVSDTANSQVLIPVVNSKSATAPAIALYGIDNDARDGIVDITITALPRMIMTGGNVLVVS